MLDGNTIGAIVLLLAFGLWAFLDYCKKTPRELADDAIADEMEKTFRNKET